MTECTRTGFADSSALLGHELAYVLGQIDDVHALPILESVLRDEAQHPMVRHEAAEAMGAISDLSSVPILEEFLHKQGENVSVTETCEIALAKIKYDHSPSGSAARSAYDSIDPAPPVTSMHGTDNDQSGAVKDLSTAELRTLLLDSKKSLFERYRAMFALRNIGDREAVLALADGFADSSALFRWVLIRMSGLERPAAPG